MHGIPFHTDILNIEKELKVHRYRKSIQIAKI